MDLLVMILVAGILAVACIPYLSKGQEAQGGISQSVLSTSTFQAEDLPYCDVTLCKRVKCFTYYQEVLGLWHS